MKYKKVKVQFEGEEGKRDYLQFRRFVGDTQHQVLYRAPDTEAGIASLNRRNPDYKEAKERRL